MKKIKRISILLAPLLMLVFSCKQYVVDGVVKSLTEIDSGDGNLHIVSNTSAQDLIGLKEPALTSQEVKKLETLKGFLKDAMCSNGREEEDLKAEYTKSYNEFFDWLSKDFNMQKEFINAFNKINDILTKAVDESKKVRPDQQSLGFNEYLCYKIKNSRGGAISLYFQKIADAFGTEDYKKQDDEGSQKPEKCNEEIFKVIKKVLTEGENNKELANLKNCTNL
ncbi:hypothetical protein QIA41_04680 (plasmid) [Borreliella sinica]|uniref:hypothetical protein n=1 Tax=Borreliella sinica TaxID=87162 RepID=UPI002A240844|nr:hypothetical protein [Borreliella sinica]WPM06391.1 hypothetical protein QIA41_04680 [Borreliella sinica]